MKYVLGFNIGNTNTMLGFFKEEKVLPLKTYSFKTDRNITAGELAATVTDFINIFSKDNDNTLSIAGVIFSSVVTEVNKCYDEMSKNLFNIDPLEIDSNTKLNIIIKYDNPDELGPDRIANATAVYNEYKKDAIIIDLGTANTFCVIQSDGTFDGGLIGPGIGISIDALAEKTSKLSRINFEKPEKLIATNTVEALKSGFFYGYLTMIEGIIKEIKKVYNKKFLIILTGGVSTIISANLKIKHIIDPLLTMKGIKYIYNLNKL